MIHPDKIYHTGFEISSLDDAARNIVEDLIKKEYSYQSMLYFAAQLQWYVLNAELIRNELNATRERDRELIKKFRRPE